MNDSALPLPQQGPDLNKLLACYEGRRVLVTGHTGFKGSWLALWLSELRADVWGLALDPHTEPNLFTEADIAGAVTDLRCDIRNYAALYEQLCAAEPEVVFHLAAQPLVLESYETARETFETNLMGSVNVFECCRSVSSVSTVVHVGTDKCYANSEKALPFTESDALGGRDPYSASKAAAEMALAAYLESFFGAEGRVNAASGRAGNVIGGGDWAANRIIPDCVRALTAGQEVGVRRPDAVRPWQHVLEALSGYLVLGARLMAGDANAQGAWNFGPAEESVQNVRDLVDAFLAAWGSGKWTEQGETNAPHEAGVLRLDCGKARTRLNWSPRWGFGETVERTARWYRNHMENGDARAACLDDIRDYTRA